MITTADFLKNRLPARLIPHLSRPLGEQAKQEATARGLKWQEFPTIEAKNPRGYLRLWPTDILSAALHAVVRDITESIKDTQYDLA